MKFKRGDNVIVISGNDRGTTGTILSVVRDKERGENDRVVVEGVNVRTKHTKPTQAEPKGDRIQKEFPIHASNVMFLDPATNKRSRKRPQEA